MSLQAKNPQRSSHFAAAQFGNPARWREPILDPPQVGKLPGETFLGRLLELSSMEVSFGSMLPGEAMPFLHAHKQNEELYVILSGEGEMQVDGECIPLRSGTVIRIAQPGLRAWRATGRDPMGYLVVQAKAGSLEQAAGGDGIIADVELRWPEAGEPADQGLSWPLGKVFL
ncbi:MAG: cupin domain-containing protein [Holophaga sp.]|nr:cupin domain-containing protein [Holophaga sp.]